MFVFTKYSKNNKIWLQCKIVVFYVNYPSFQCHPSEIIPNFWPVVYIIRDGQNYMLFRWKAIRKLTLMRPILCFHPEKTCSLIIKLKKASFSLRRRLSPHKRSNVSGSQTPDLVWQSCGSRLESDGGINHVWSQAHFCSLWGWGWLLHSSPGQSNSGQHRKCKELSRPQQDFLSQLHWASKCSAIFHLTHNKLRRVNHLLLYY